MRARVLLLTFCIVAGVALAQETSNVVQPDNWWEVLPRPGYAALTILGSILWFLHRGLEPH